MIKSFLTYVAEDIYKRYGADLSRLTVVFPNKRAALFLNQELARMAEKPIWAPAYVTISELFRSRSQLSIANPIQSVCLLHKSYTSVTGIDETLDHFFGWGQLLLADFDDIDKNMADAQQLFHNVRDLHELDSIEYLDEEQKQLIMRFFGNFTGDETQLRKKFISLWSNLYNVYADYRQRLRERGLAYEGMLYRDVVEHDKGELPGDHYLFVGFNVLQKVEQRLFDQLREGGGQPSTGTTTIITPTLLTMRRAPMSANGPDATPTPSTMRTKTSTDNSAERNAYASCQHQRKTCKLAIFLHGYGRTNATRTESERRWYSATNTCFPPSSIVFPPRWRW